MSTRIYLKECLTKDLNYIFDNIENYDDEDYIDLTKIIIEIQPDSVKDFTIDFKIDTTFLKTITKENLKKIIDNYMIFIAELKEKQNEKIKEIMNNNLTDIEQIKIFLGDIYYENNKKIHEFGQSDIAKKRGYNSFNFNDNEPLTLIHSSYYEYDIFNLVNIFNNFDFDNKTLLLYI